MLVKPDSERKTQLEKKLYSAEVIYFYLKLLAKVLADKPNQQNLSYYERAGKSYQYCKVNWGHLNVNLTELLVRRLTC